MLKYFPFAKTEGIFKDFRLQAMNLGSKVCEINFMRKDVSFKGYKYVCGFSEFEEFVVNKEPGGKWLRYVAMVSVVCGIATVCIYLKLKKYGDEGPFRSSIKGWIPRALQRLLIDKTRVQIRDDMYPLHHFQDLMARVNENGHKISGNSRDNARRLLVSEIQAKGCTPFEVAPASKTYVSPSDCDLQHYSVHDLYAPVSTARITADHIIMMVDVDYYVENLDDYFGRGYCGVLHTFSPKKVSGLDGDSRFRIINNEVEYEVGGGGHWKHKIWDWTATGEFLEFNAPKETIWQYLLSFIGIDKVVYQKVYHSRPFKSTDDRALVWLCPQTSCYRFRYFETDLKARKIKRVDYRSTVRNGWNSIIAAIEADDGETNLLLQSLGRDGEDACVNMRKEDVDVLMGIDMLQSVTTRMKQMGYDDPNDLALFTQYHKNKTVPKDCSLRIMKSVKPDVHWPLRSNFEEFEACARIYAPPLVSDPNLIPDIKNIDTLKLSVTKRITEHLNTSVPKDIYKNYAIEFVGLVLNGEQHVGFPYDEEETIKLLNKPTQQAQIRQIVESLDVEPRIDIKAFVKKEPTNKAGRVISAFGDFRFIKNLSSFTLAFRDVILHSENNSHWFMPGRRPKEIADTVCDYVRNLVEPVEGDYANMDGSVSAWIQRNVMNAIIMQWVSVEHRLELEGLLNGLIHCPAHAKQFNFQYTPGPGVKSGSPTTCDFNTILNAYVMYCAIRRTDKLLKPNEAFKLIGLCFGDDSLFEQRYARAWSRVGRELGMELKIEPFESEKGITFLARVFPDPWSSTTSFQDPLRTMRKLHLTMRPKQISLETAAVDRLSGYLVTDGKTPIIGDYCRKVVSHYRRTATYQKDKNKDLRGDRHSEKSYWLFGDETESWPQDEKLQALMLQCMAARLEIEVSTLEQLQKEIRNAEDIWSIPTIDRSELEAPWKDTVLSDGLELMDEFKIVKSTENEQARKQSNIVRVFREDSKSDRRGFPRLPIPTPRLRHPSAPPMPEESPENGSTINEQFVRQTEITRVDECSRGDDHTNKVSPLHDVRSGKSRTDDSNEKYCEIARADATPIGNVESIQPKPRENGLVSNDQIMPETVEGRRNSNGGPTRPGKLQGEDVRAIRKSSPTVRSRGGKGQGGPNIVSPNPDIVEGGRTSTNSTPRANIQIDNGSGDCDDGCGNGWTQVGKSRKGKPDGGKRSQSDEGRPSRRNQTRFASRPNFRERGSGTDRRTERTQKFQAERINRTWYYPKPQIKIDRVGKAVKEEVKPEKIDKLKSG